MACRKGRQPASSGLCKAVHTCLYVLASVRVPVLEREDVSHFYFLVRKRDQHKRTGNIDFECKALGGMFGDVGGKGNSEF